MYGLAVNLIVSVSGHPWIIDVISFPASNKGRILKKMKHIVNFTFRYSNKINSDTGIFAKRTGICIEFFVV